jgi:hypothetical protein
MSMGLHSLPDVYQSSWVEMTPNIAMRFEVDHLNRSATLYFGHRNDYVITLEQNSLNQLVELGSAARQELMNPPADDQ